MVKVLPEETSAANQETSNGNTRITSGAAEAAKQEEANFLRELEAEFNSGAATEAAEPCTKRNSRGKRKSST